LCAAQDNVRDDTGAGREYEAQGGESAKTFASEAKEKIDVSRCCACGCAAKIERMCMRAQIHTDRRVHNHLLSCAWSSICKAAACTKVLCRNQLQT